MHERCSETSILTCACTEGCACLYTLRLQGEFENLNDGDLNIFVRLGSDYNGNYYEYEVPLKVTPWGGLLPEDIWPTDNNIDVVFEDLKTLKLTRNAAMENDPTLSLTNKYTITTTDGHRLT